MSGGRFRRSITRVVHVSTGILCVAAASACGADQVDSAAAPLGSNAEATCVALWNAGANDENRGAIANPAIPWQVEVGRWVVNHPAEDNTGEGCSYLFSTRERWTSFSGARKTDGEFEWQPRLTQHGKRLPDQRILPSSFDVRPDGTIR